MEKKECRIDTLTLSPVEKKNRSALPPPRAPLRPSSHTPRAQAAMGGERAFKVNTKKARAAAAKAECFVELSAFFACMMVSERGEGKGREACDRAGGVCVCVWRRRFLSDPARPSRQPCPSLLFPRSQANKYDAEGACVTARKALDRCVSTAVREGGGEGGGGAGQGCGRVAALAPVCLLTPPLTLFPQASRTRTRTTINYHLQRLSRALRR